MKAPELAAAIAPHLPGWTFDPAYDHIAYLVRADGARIGVMVGSWAAKGRVSIAGMWPKFADGSTYWSSRERAEITCAATRTPEAIAKEIQRRLIPGYDHAYAQALAYVTKSDAAAREAQAVAERLAAALDARVGMNNHRRGDGVHIIGEPACVRRLVVQPAYDGIEPRPVSVDFTVTDVDPETAAEVLAILKAAEDRKREDTQARIGLQAMHDAEDAAEAEHEVAIAEECARRRIG